MPLRYLVTFILPVLGLAACADTQSATGPSGRTPPEGTRKVWQFVATTGQINDALVHLTEGVDVKIKLFCGPGVDPHSFAASTQDVQAMEDADAIFYNGFHLEDKLHDLLHGRYAEKAWAMADAFPEQHRLDRLEDGKIDPGAPFDPHIWNHLPAWSECVGGLVARLTEIDPGNAESYRRNGDAYIGQIMDTHSWSQTQLAQLPADRRVLISAHDAFSYFAKVYDLEAVAVLGIGNNPEADVRTMRAVAETICDRRVPVIFMESISNSKIIDALQEACAARNWDVKIAEQTLYSDDLGETPPQDSFLGAFRSNVQIIADSLKN